MKGSMMLTQDTGIARDRIIPVGGTACSAGIALTQPPNREPALWKQAIDQMLEWKTKRSVDNCEDYPTQDVADTAIDFAVDQSDTGTSAPDSIVPSGGGRIAMEWNTPFQTIIVEFIGLGAATYIRFDSAGKVAARDTLRRNPQSRRLQLQG